MPAPGRRLVDNETFITMLVVAGEDKKVRGMLRKVLELPDDKRHLLIRDWTEELRNAGAPHDFIAAVACLADDRVAWRVQDALFRGRFEPIWPPQTKRRKLGVFHGYSLRGWVLLAAAGALAVLAGLSATGVWPAGIGGMERIFAALCLTIGATLLFSAADM